MPKVSLSNVAAVRRSIQQEKKRRQRQAKVALQRIGTDAQTSIRRNISKPRFPGYAMRGRLRGAVDLTKVKRISRGWMIRVFVRTNGPQRAYASIHEFGGTIRAKSAEYLQFFIPGVGWRKVKEVQITAKHYFRDGIRATERRLKKLLK